jgi:hypothetical protein
MIVYFRDHRIEIRPAAPRGLEWLITKRDFVQSTGYDLQATDPQPLLERCKATIDDLCLTGGRRGPAQSQPYDRDAPKRSKRMTARELWGA